MKQFIKKRTIILVLLQAIYVAKVLSLECILYCEDKVAIAFLC